MTRTGPRPRLVIDFEHGAAYGDAAESVRIFDEFRPLFVRFREAWLFHSSAASMVRGFYYPPSSPDRFGIPRAQGPGMVLIDDRDDQLWLSGAGCGEAGARATGALTVLTALCGTSGWGDQVDSDLAMYDEMHFVDGDLVTARPLSERSRVAPPGKTFIRDGRLICRMEYDKDGTSPLDLRDLWARATETHGWLGRPTALALYDDRAKSELAGYEGCHLIATGESGRELWLQFPEPDTSERLSPGAARVLYTGSFTEYEAIKASIFRSVEVDINPPDDRPLKDRVLGRHRIPPAVIRWP